MRPAFTRTVLPLALCQSYLFAGNTIVISTTALVGALLAPSPLMATVPMGLQFLGMVSASMPVSLLMGRHGRGLGFSLGAVLGMLAGLVGAAAIVLGQFWLFCIATFLYGTYAGASAFFRFAAAEAVEGPLKARAISWVLLGGILAAFVGPALADASKDWLAPFLFAGCFLVVTGLASLMLATVQLTRFAPLSTAGGGTGGRPLGEIVRQPRFLVALASAAVGQSVMSFLMVATPLAMIGCGHAFGDATMVIKWHVVAMFAPSFVTGQLIQRFGVERIIVTGALLNLGCVLVNTQGLEVVHFWLGLVLLGVGWNFMFVGGTTLLTRAYAPEERAKVEGINEVAMFSTVVLASGASGAMLEIMGWAAMNLLVIAPIVAVTIAVFLLARAEARPA
ncbi:MAG: MFS transporter [Geminicoccaceae bacterium]|nr:MAG: MFS transporter [Geminicoccaceae bacterium]